MSDLHALKPGASVAGYDIIRVLGAGGFGITYEAQSPITGKRVAIKEFFPRGIASRDGTTRISFDAKENEIVAWALKRFETSTTDQCRLSHPNIVNVIHYVKDNGTGYMIMEYVEGNTFEHWLRAREASPSESELRPLIEPVLSALEYLHEQKLIHRDIAPDNIMIKSDHRPMIIDFGAIKMIATETQMRSKASRSYMVSKPFYSPPEQLEDGVSLDARADIYALAATIYRALAGRPPANAAERTQKIARKREDPYVPLASIGAAAPATLVAAVDRAMSYDPEERQTSIAEFRESLGWADSEEPTVIAPREEESLDVSEKSEFAAFARGSGTEEVEPAKSGRRLLVPVLGLAAVTAILFLAFGPLGFKNAPVEKPERVVVTPKAAPAVAPAPAPVAAPTKQTAPPAAQKKADDRLPQQQTQQIPATPAVRPAGDTRRAFLVEENPGSQQFTRIAGTVNWRTETTSPGAGKASEPGVRIDVDIPERKMRVTIIIRRNRDPSLSSTHTFEMQFSGNDSFGGVAQVPVLRMKDSEAAPGVPLAGISTRITYDFFLIGLSATEADRERNLQRMKTLNWFEIPIVYANGRRAVVTFEKGASGEKVLAEALAAWGN
jgi:serine/threonine protein kinase